MSKKRNHYDNDEDRKASEKSMRKQRKKSKSSKRSKEKDYLRDVVSGNIDPDAYQDYTDHQQ